MRRWSEGEREIERLLATGHLQQVPPNREHAVALLAQARQSLTVAQMAIDAGALAPAYGQLWDAIRKALTALLWTQGLRPTTKGGHLAVQLAAQAQFGQGTLRGALAPLGRVRSKRNDLEYPDPGTSLSPVEIDFAHQCADDVVAMAAQLLDSLPVWH